MASANDRQEGGEHYLKFGAVGPQPWDIINAFGLGYFDGNAVKYLLRWKHKGGIGDLKKALHYIHKLIELEEERVHPKSFLNP